MPDNNPRNPLLPLWLREYPFTYWDNRIEKINKYNPEDRLEALRTALELSDLYTHLFVARAQNPDQPWFLVKEDVTGPNIGNTLKKLTEETDHGDTIFVEKLLEDHDGLISYETTEETEEWDVSLEDWIAADFLGCPVNFHHEEKELEFIESPDLHYGGANAILNFHQENRKLLNDFKHGFRVLPFDIYTLDFLIDEGLMPESEEVDTLREQLLEESRTWEFSFVRMVTEEAPEEAWYDYEVTLNLHSANISACVDLCRLTLKQLHNLFGRGGDQFIEEDLKNLFSHSDAEEPLVVDIIEHIGDFQVVYGPGDDSKEE